jgi:hypothetical protein
VIGGRIHDSGVELLMGYVDSALLDLTEWMCRRFQAWTGRTNVWLAFQLTNLSIVIYFIWVAALYWLSADLAVRVFVALFCGGVFFALTRTLFKTSIEIAETNAYRRVANGLRNPRRIRDAQLRIAFLTLSILLSYPLWFAYVASGSRFVLLTEALIVLTTVVLYVLACDPLPPCAGKVRDWLSGLRPARARLVRDNPARVVSGRSGVQRSAQAAASLGRRANRLCRMRSTPAKRPLSVTRMTTSAPSSTRFLFTIR